MTAPGTYRSGAGFRHVRIFELDSSGYPAATSATVYEGYRIEGAKALTLDDPEPRDIVHVGDDRVIQRDILPPDTPISGELVVAKIQDTIDALLSDDLSKTIGEAKFFGIGTGNRGEENQVAVLAYRQTLNTEAGSSTFGKRLWEGRLFPRCYVVARETGFADTPEEKPYSFRPLIVAAHLWGESFTTISEGFTQAQGLRLVSEYKPKVVAFQGISTQLTFTMPTGEPPASAEKIEVWDAGVLQTAGQVTASTTILVFAASVTDGNIIVAFYEYE